MIEDETGPAPTIAFGEQLPADEQPAAGDAYHAECHADGAIWSGDIQGWVSDSAYDLCHGDKSTPCRKVGFRYLQVGDFDTFMQPLVA